MRVICGPRRRLLPPICPSATVPFPPVTARFLPFISYVCEDSSPQFRMIPRQLEQFARLLGSSRLLMEVARSAHSLNYDPVFSNSSAFQVFLPWEYAVLWFREGHHFFFSDLFSLILRPGPVFFTGLTLLASTRHGGLASFEKISPLRIG